VLNKLNLWPVALLEEPFGAKLRELVHDGRFFSVNCLLRMLRLIGLID
jgi:hypothetical protein